MTSIISGEKVSDRPQADGRRYVRYRYQIQDNNADTFVHFHGSKLVSEDFDVDADLIIQGANLVSSLENQEDQNMENPDLEAISLTLVLNPQFSTSKRLAKKLIYWMMRERDPRIVIWLEPLIVHLRENYTAQQLSNFLDLPVDKLIKMNRRINAILSDSGTVKEQLALFDVEEDILDD